MNAHPYDEVFGKLTRLLAALDLEMHTPMRGSTYTCKRRQRRPRLFAAPPSIDGED